MQLEDYFDFETEPVERIRLKGTRIDLDFVVALFHQGLRAEEIAKYFCAPLELEQSCAALAYYLHNREEVDAYLTRREAIAAAHYAAHLAKGPSDVALKLRAAKAQRKLAESREASRVPSRS